MKISLALLTYFAWRAHALTNEFLHLPAGFSLENVFHVDESAFNFQ